MRHIYKPFFYFVLLLMALPVMAQTPGFFSGLPDVPIMPGLQEIEGEIVTFDKPEGRIIQTSVLTDVPPAKIMRFYTETLPQFGWTYISDQKFFRKDEFLVFDFKQVQHGGVVKIMVTPSL